MERQLYLASSDGFTATCDAYVVRNINSYYNELRLLSIVGGQAATKAIAAGVLKKNTEPVRLTPLADDGELKSIGAIRMGDSGPWKSRIMRLPQTKAWHTLIYSMTLEYNREEPSFVLLGEPGATDAVGRHLQFLNRRITVPVHPSWAGWLWDRGLESGEIKPLISSGVSAWECSPDQDALKKDISEAIRTGLLTVREKEEADATLRIAS